MCCIAWRHKEMKINAYVYVNTQIKHQYVHTHKYIYTHVYTITTLLREGKYPKCKLNFSSWFLKGGLEHVSLHFEGTLKTLPTKTIPGGRSAVNFALKGVFPKMYLTFWRKVGWKEWWLYTCQTPLHSENPGKPVRNSRIPGWSPAGIPGWFSVRIVFLVHVHHLEFSPQVN